MYTKRTEGKRLQKFSQNLSATIRQRRSI